MLSYIDYLILVKRFDINLNNLSNKVIKEITRLSWKIIGLLFIGNSIRLQLVK